MKVQINIERLLSYDAVTSKLTLIRVLHDFSVDRQFHAIYRDEEQLAPNLKLIRYIAENPICLGRSQNSQNLHLFKF